MRTAKSTLGLVCALALQFGCNEEQPLLGGPPAGGAGPASGAGGKAGVPADAGTKPADDRPSWVMMGGNLQNHYWNPLEKSLSVANVAGLKEKWRFTVAGFPPGSPVIADGKVFVMATGGTYAIDLKTGMELWSRADVTGTASAAYADGFVYLHGRGASLWKLNAADGTTVWGPIRTYEIMSCDGTSSPIVADGKVLVGHSCGGAEVGMTPDKAIVRGGVEAFKAEDGTQAWRFFTAKEGVENGAMVWSTVGVDLASKTVFATTGNNYTLLGENSDAIFAIDLATGALRWKKQVRAIDVWSRGDPNFVNPTGQALDTDFGANPVVADVGGKELVAAGDKGSSWWTLDRETGQLLWSRTDLSATNSPANGGVLMNGAFDGKYFYAASNEPPADCVLHVMDPLTGADVVPPVKLGAIIWGAPSLANGLLFVPVNSVLKVFEAATLKELVSFDTGGTIAAGAPAIVDGIVVVGSGLQYVFGGPAVLNNNQVIAYSLDGTGASGAVGPARGGAATWSAIYDEIVVGTGCNGSALCHGGEVGMLPMTAKDDTYKLLVGIDAAGMNLTQSGMNCADVDIKRVAAGKPDESLLVKKLEGKPPCGEPMPPTGMLTAAQIKQVRDWISAGALNN